MKKNHKNAIIGGLLAVVFVMSVGYAAFYTSLNISGTAGISTTWDVHIKSIDATAGASFNDTSKTMVGKDGLTANFGVKLVSPGDSVTYTIVVENAGTVNAKLDDIKFNVTQDTNAEKDDGGNVIEPFVYSYNGISTKDSASSSNAGYIAAGTTKSFTVTVKYNDKITSDPAVKTSSLKMTLSYIQS